METNDTTTPSTETTTPVVTKETTTDELTERLKKSTQHKEPTVATTEVWNFDTPMEPETPAATTETKTEPTTTPATNTPETVTQEPKISKDMKMATARITVSALDSTQRVIFTPLINRKYAKKFNDGEVKKLDETNIIDEEKSRLSVEDLPLRNKFDRLMKKRDKKIKDIPFTDTESQDLEKIFYQYMDATNKTLPPEIMLVIGISNVVGKRAIDLFTE